MKRTKSILLALLLCQFFMSVIVAQDEDDAWKDAMAKARNDIGQFLIKEKPPESSQPVITSGSYFLDQFKKEREVKGTLQIGPNSLPIEGKLAVADTDLKLIVCLRVAQAMLKVANEAGDDAADLPQKWEEAKKAVLDELTKKNEKQLSALGNVERLAWEQFLDEWQKDALKADSARFKDALVQAAYEIAKAGSDITSIQETVAQQAQATAAGTGTAGAGAATRPGGFYPSDVIHERLMNGIYRRHNRRMNKITRIRARSGRY